AAARGAAAWNAADATLDSLRAELTQIAVALEESTRAAHALDASADGIVATLDQIDAVFGAAFDAFDRAAGDVRAAHAHGEAVRSGIVAMHEATGRAGAIVDAVGEISAESGLLAINAAIEAARAGERGLGFTVIADEIGRLANETRDATDGIAETIEALRGRSNELEATSARGAEDMDAVVVDAQSGREAIDALRATIGASADRTRSVATTARALAARSNAILAELATARDALADLGREEREAARFALSDLLGDAHRLAENAGVQLTVGRLHQLLTSAAVEIEGVFARALAEGRTTFAALGDTDYVELRGAEVEHLARFVDVRTAPRDGLVPKKWRTSYDAAVDTEAMAVLDRTMASEPLIGSMGLFDPNGFAIAMPSFVSTTPEWSRNRAKWIFADPIMQRMVKVGIGKPVLPRPWSAFAYLQADTGAVFINIATAIFVNGERVAACSLIVEASRAAD
ncbi:MAG: hypothetical protein JO103_01175, partial [Candidatus Eremiobacteraeota bacterium]|nr:hypothetical protein [Candidatus Eremiobacteraeota bacterium]